MKKTVLAGIGLASLLILGATISAASIVRQCL